MHRTTTARRPCLLVSLLLLFAPLQAMDRVVPAPSAQDQLTIREKQAGSQRDRVLVDQYGREVSLRGFNVSGKVKHAEFGFKPFRNVEDARRSFALLRQTTGSNVIRFTVAWEGVQPDGPWQVDEDYLAAVTAQVGAATEAGLYVLVDYHSDLYSRHTFRPDSPHTGNGAPAWVVSDLYGKENCGIPCAVTWGAYKLSDPAVRNAIRGFWYDHWILDRELPGLELVNRGSNQCADVSGGVMENSRRVIGWGCHGGNNQRWHYHTDGSLRSAANGNYCLDVAGARRSNGTAIQIYQCNGSAAQQFMVDARGRFHSLLDLNKCVEQRQGELQLQECRMDQPAQQFQLRDGSSGEDVGAGLAYVQQQFVWQVGQLAAYMAAHLDAHQLARVIGLDPINEPFDGGIGEMSYADWDNDILWPVYQRVRSALDEQPAWRSKPVYAEPNVFWSSLVDVIAPATGGGYLRYKPGDGFVFNSHFYDQGRMGISDLSVARNGAYFANMDLIRDEARFLQLVPFVSEFGMWLEGWGHTDTERVTNGSYQGLESSNRQRGKDRYVDFYTPLVSGVQWQWDYYYDNHHEYQNGNPSRLLTEDDAWNGENFSVVAQYGTSLNVAQALVARMYPRAVQGELMHFAYEGLVPDRAGEVMSYHSIRASRDGHYRDREFFRDTRFGFAVWRGRTSAMPTELWLPPQLDPSRLTIITDKGVFRDLPVGGAPVGSGGAVQLLADGNDGGHRLMVWDDRTDPGYRFLLVMDGDAGLSALALDDLYAALRDTVNSERSPVYLSGAMTHSGYAADKGRSEWFSLVNGRSGRCADVAGGWAINGRNIQSWRCNGSNAQRWRHDPDTGLVHSALNTSMCLDHGNRLANNGNVVLYRCQDSDRFRWQRQGNSLRPAQAPGLALDAYGTTDGSNIGLWQHNGEPQQGWVLQY